MAYWFFSRDTDKIPSKRENVSIFKPQKTNKYYWFRTRFVSELNFGLIQGIPSGIFKETNVKLNQYFFNHQRQIINGMFLRANLLELEAEKPIVILNKDDAEELDVRPLERIELAYRKSKIVAIVNVAEKFIKPGEIGLYSIVAEKLHAKKGKRINVTPSLPPTSLMYIRRKLIGRTLKKAEIMEIVKDVVKQKLSEIELTSFVVALYNYGMTMDETAALSAAMTDTGQILHLGKKDIYDKHSIGGVSGDKTSMLLVPTIAAAGLTIPKTSSRAITSPAGTADRFECLAPVDLEMDEMKRVIKNTNGCLVWGGAIDLAPADDIFIKIEYPLSIDPLLLPSVMSKKMAVRAKNLVIDIPTGRGTKVKTIGEANELAKKFIELGKKLGMKVSCCSTFGEQPLGYGIGPALEAREALQTALTGRGPYDVVDKLANIAGTLLAFKGLRNPKEKALEILRSGKTGKKIKEIIAAQGGSPKIKPQSIPVGPECVRVTSAKGGKVWWISNESIVRIAREAGAPKNKGAGILLCKKIGDPVKRGETLFSIYSEKNYKLNRALRLTETLDIMGVGKQFNMVLAKIPEEEHEKRFILER